MNEGTRIELEADFGASWASLSLLAANVAVFSVLNARTLGMSGKEDWQTKWRVPPGKCCRSKRKEKLNCETDIRISWLYPVVGKSVVIALSTCCRDKNHNAIYVQTERENKNKIKRERKKGKKKKAVISLGIRSE